MRAGRESQNLKGTVFSSNPELRTCSSESDRRCVAPVSLEYSYINNQVAYTKESA